MFAALNVKSEYSFLDSMVNIDKYLEQAKQMGYQTVGLSDVDNLHAAYQFISKAKKMGLKPIIGLETSFRLNQNLSVRANLFAKSTVGYHNLLRFSTRKNQGHTDWSDFSDILEGLILILDPAYTDLANQLENEVEVYIGLGLRNATRQFTQKSLPFPSVRYLSANESGSLRVLHAIRAGEQLDDSLTLDSSEQLYRPDFYERYYQENAPEILNNLSLLIDQIDYDIEEDLKLPAFDQSQAANQLLRKLAFEGLKHLGIENEPDYIKRLDYELDVIHQMGFDDYFLIVADLLRFARESEIYCGMGRGSAAGSLASYTLQITQVDPVKNNLLFERFLNPERVAMPDIDIDMPDNRRADMLEYMQNRYGKDHVAQIVTFSTFGKKQAIRDVGKVYGMSELEIGSFSKMMTSRFGSLEQEYTENKRFRAEIMKSELLEQVYQAARQLEGMPRQTSVHASAVVLSAAPLYRYTALKPSDNLLLTQYEANDIEAIGLLKIDFLGIRNLTLITQMRELVLKNKNKDIDPLEIDLEDSQTLQLFRAGNTMGIFQFENPQMLKFLRNLAPSKFDDIVNATSIFRPGPSQFIPEFIARRHGKTAVESVDFSIDDLLAATYGIMIYQEQVMLVAVHFAGFSMGRADSLRRAISKKKAGEFEKFRQEFIDGAVSLGHEAELAMKIYDLIERFANYGFNRSHAYAYAALAFQIAYFKVHYPDEFYEVQIRDRKREAMLKDALLNHYQVQKLDINQATYYDHLKEGKIKLGLSNLRGVSKDYAYWISQNRPFTDFSDFVRRSPEHFQKEEVIKLLIQVGYFDKMDNNRRKLVENLPILIEHHQTFQMDLFGKTSLIFSYRDFLDYTEIEKYDFEYQLLGLGITPHPLESLAERYKGNFTPLDQLKKNQRATILVELKRLRTHRTKTGEGMAFLQVSDSKLDFDVTLFPEVYRNYLGKLEQGSFYFISGKVSEREDHLQMLADHLIDAGETAVKLWINAPDNQHNQNILKILQQFPGPHQVILHDAEKKVTSQTSIFVEENDVLLKKLAAFILKAVYK